MFTRLVWFENAAPPNKPWYTPNFRQIPSDPGHQALCLGVALRVGFRRPIRRDEINRHLRVQQTTAEEALAHPW